MSPQERKALQIVAANQPVRAIDVAEMIGTSKRSIGRALWALAGEGLIEKVGPTRNSIQWTLTEKGAAYGLESLRHPLKPYEQAASVWAYAARCAQEAKR
jgi:chromosome segregation and condensation protein ScpB